jgi:hypothetical protein
MGLLIGYPSMNSIPQLDTIGSMMITQSLQLDSFLRSDLLFECIN